MPISTANALRFMGGLTLADDRWAGTRMKLGAFQREMVTDVTALNEHNRRRINEYLFGVARKNSKTTTTGALALTFLVGDGVPGGDVVVAAGKRDQARLLLNAAKKIALASTFMGRPLGHHRAGEGWLHIQRDRIYFPELDASIFPVSADAQNEQGLNPNVAIVDELHVAAEKDRDLYDALITAQGARENPLMIALTTAGPRPAGPCHALYQYGKEIASGLRSDPAFAMRWYEADADLAIDDPRAWAQANPGLDTIVSREYLARQSRAVLDGRMPEYAFRRLNLNQWTTATERWLPWKKWDACGGAPSIPDGAAVYVACDAALSRDTFGIAWVWVEPEGLTIEVLNEAGLYVPKSVAVAHLCVKKFDAPREGDYIDQNEVEMFLLGLAQKYAIVKVGYDPAYMTLLALSLAERGLPMEVFPQSTERMTHATETLQRLALDARIRHGNDPVLNAEMAAVEVSPTERGVRISKRKTALKIDCTIASAMALDLALGLEDEPTDFAFSV